MQTVQKEGLELFKEKIKIMAISISVPLLEWVIKLIV